MSKGIAETWRELLAVVESENRDQLTLFERSLDERELHPSFRNAIEAQIELARGKPQRAWERIALATKERELGPHERLMRGMLFMMLGRAEEALEDLKAARKARLWDPRVEAGIGNIALRRGDDGPAERFLHQALKKQPAQWTERMKLCLVQRRMGKYKAALASAYAVIKAAPDFETGWLNLAGIMVDMGKPEDALRVVLPVAKKREDWLLLRASICDVLRAAGRYDEAIATLAPITVKVGNPHLAMDLVELYILAGVPDMAEAAIAIIDAFKIDSARLSFLKGTLEELKGPAFHEVALAHYEVAVEQERDFWPALDALASLLSLEGPLQDLERARTLYEEAVGNPQKPIRPLLNLTLCWADEGRVDEAVDKVQQVLAKTNLRHEDKEHAKRVLELLKEERARVG